MDDHERAAWERQPGETRRAYELFRQFRDLGAQRSLRRLTETPDGQRVPSHVERWSARWEWRRRADAWDDEHDRVDDLARLDALKAMHHNHALAGKVALAKALAALQALPPEAIPAGAAVRLLDVGTKLERSTLTTSVAELQGRSTSADVIDDPWEVIARELQAT